MATPGRVSHVSSAPPAKHPSGLSLVLVFGPLTLLAEWLIAHTHHRPLAAVTFATSALVLWTATEVFVRHGLSGEPSFPTLDGGRASRVGVRGGLRKACWAVGLIASVTVVARAISTSMS